MSVLETYALGRTVLGADIGGIPELIHPGETGDNFESANVDSLTAVMTRFENFSDSKIATLGRAGRQWVESEFTAQRYHERLLNLYASLGVEL